VSCALSTNHHHQNVAERAVSVGCLPLALYLASFILAFDHPRWYVRPLFMVALVRPARRDAYYVLAEPPVAVPLYPRGLSSPACSATASCAAQARPLHLTRYYLMISLGGAIGAVLCILAPLTLPGYSSSASRWSFLPSPRLRSRRF